MSKITEISSIPVSSKKKKKSDHKEDPLTYLEHCIDTMFGTLGSQKITQIKSKREFRTSSLPFCPILSFLAEPRIESYDKSHYTSTGTGIHTTIQSWLSVNKIPQDWMYGSWKCTGCHAIKKNQMRPKKPCGCKFQVSTTDFHRGWPKHWT